MHSSTLCVTLILSVLAIFVVSINAETNVNFYFADMLHGVGSEVGGTCNCTNGVVTSRPSCTESPVIVVGGGWSGLTAAVELKKRGCKVVLLEAQDYLGGRSKTSYGDAIVEFGSNWVHGVIGHPFIPFLESLGYNTSDPHIIKKVDSGNAAVIGYPGYWYANDTRLNDSDIDRTFVVSEQWFEHMAEAITERTADKTSSEYQPKDVPIELGELKSPSVLNWKSSLTPAEIGYSNWHRNNIYHEDLAASVEQMSLFNFDPASRLYEGGNNVLPIGYSAVVKTYATSVTAETYLNTPVTRIEHSETGVTVYTANGTVFNGSTVIVTASVGVLKANVIDFEPPVPPAIAEAINHLDMGLLDKIWLQFATPFWDVNTYTWFVLPDSDDPSHKESFITTFFNALIEERGVDQNVLGFFVGADSVYKLFLSDQEIIDNSMPVLRAIFGATIPEPIAVIRTNWTFNPWTRGVYSYPRTYSEIDDFDAFVVNDTKSSLHFAGEHTSRTGFGYQYGAASTGYREARSILALPENVAAGVTQISEEEYQRLAGYPNNVTSVSEDPTGILNGTTGAREVGDNPEISHPKVQIVNQVIRVPKGRGIYSEASSVFLQRKKEGKC